MAFNFSRYKNREVVRNQSNRYLKQLSNRKVRFIDHFETAKFKYPSQALLGQLSIENEVWGVGSRFYKIAHKHYGDAGLWWIIPWFNKVPLESDFSPGDVVFVPKPLETILSFFE